ncbi:MAG: 16S rRNA (cytidine(1402)-2'-O)-methyltransferase [Clostridiales bacterium]|nr:16S rRNA (cytidine(1402)-2'-O)-methyltransferase [Clostridiales bacterium]
MSGKLYVVGTPIGNLGDFSPRAVEVLNQVDFIAAEDTRVTMKLLNHFDIKKEMVSYYEHNKRQRGEIICSRIENGEDCAIVTDAGMPAISDPGEDLVALCREIGIEVESVPGPTAFATALAVSGMPSGRFTFEGFLSVNKKSRREHLEDIKDEKRTMIFYEAPHKLKTTLNDLYNVLGDREIAIVRELTKIHEEVVRTTLSQAQTMYDECPPKGEFVLIIKGREGSDVQNITLESAVKMAQDLVEKGMSINSASREVAAKTPFKKGDIYKALL